MSRDSRKFYEGGDFTPPSQKGAETPSIQGLSFEYDEPETYLDINEVNVAMLENNPKVAITFIKNTIEDGKRLSEKTMNRLTSAVSKDRNVALSGDLFIILVKARYECNLDLVFAQILRNTEVSLKVLLELGLESLDDTQIDKLLTSINNDFVSVEEFFVKADIELVKKVKDKFLPIINSNWSKPEKAILKRLKETDQTEKIALFS